MKNFEENTSHLLASPMHLKKHKLGRNQENINKKDILNLIKVPSNVNPFILNESISKRYH